MNKKPCLKAAFCVLLSMVFAASTPLYAFAASESDLRNAVVSTASGEVGYTGTSTKSKYGEWYGYQGSWCTTFVLWCFNKAGEKNDVTLNGVIIPRGGNCNSMISWFKNKSRYYSRSKYTPSSGDLVFFDWNDNDSCDHVGIVDYVSGSTVYTIEGNCSGKVKARSYTKSGSKPYNNISSIMGYASVNYASVAGSSSGKTTKKQTTTKKKSTTKKQTTTQKKTTTKKQTTTKKHTTTKKKSTTKKQTTTKKKSTTEKTTEKTSTKKETKTTSTTKASAESTEQTSLSALSLDAASHELQVGDTVKLGYSIEPADANAVVGYFCDEEGIIEIGADGEITALAPGTATVVVCANNDLYSQCDFTVTEAVGEVSSVSQQSSRKVVGKVSDVETTSENAESILTRMGININALSKNKQLYIIPAAIIGITALVSLFAAVAKKIKSRKNPKK